MTNEILIAATRAKWQEWESFLEYMRDKLLDDTMSMRGTAAYDNLLAAAANTEQAMAEIGTAILKAHKEAT